MASFYSLKAAQPTGVFDFSQLKGKVVLIVNTASKCGFTPQFDGLEQLYNKYKERGFTILGFPSNQFAQQDPGSDESISEFCKKNYGVSFPIMSKSDVNGANANDVFKFLKHERPGLFGTEGIKWNFTKFLVNRDGEVVERFSPTTTPDAIAPHIERLL